jgi:hypothetical protein
MERGVVSPLKLHADFRSGDQSTGGAGSSFAQAPAGRFADL